MPDEPLRYQSPGRIAIGLIAADEQPESRSC